MTPNKQHLESAIAAASSYAEADKSDPFALRRALTHIRLGIGMDFATQRGGDGGPNYYDAQPMPVTRQLPAGYTLSDGSSSWEARDWRNRQRP